jgi:hypothetical protein
VDAVAGGTHPPLFEARAERDEIATAIKVVSKVEFPGGPQEGPAVLCHSLWSRLAPFYLPRAVVTRLS